jgi:hypothetical protein
MPKQKSSYATSRVAVEESPGVKAATRTKAPVRPSQPDFAVLPEAIEAAGVWQANKRVNALWGTNEPRNSWVLIAGVGWKKLGSSSDSSALALTVLASHGKLTQARVDYREESDGYIHELYVW